MYLGQQGEQEAGSGERAAAVRAALHAQQRRQQLAHALCMRLRHVRQIAAGQQLCAVIWRHPMEGASLLAFTRQVCRCDAAMPAGHQRDTMPCEGAQRCKGQRPVALPARGQHLLQILQYGLKGAIQRV
jgi:hypothetical protein